MSTPTVTKSPEASRYEMAVDGKLAGFIEYVDEGDALVFAHTEVFEEFSGQALAATLVTEALDDVRAAGRVVRPECAYVAGFIAKHPDYQDLIA